MNGPKRARKHNSCGPKTDALRERILRVPSKQEFLKQTYKNKKTAHNIPQRSNSLPCRARPPKEYPPKAAIKPINAETSTIPVRQPCQNNFPKAPVSGNP